LNFTGKAKPFRTSGGIAAALKMSSDKFSRQAFSLEESMNRHQTK